MTVINICAIVQWLSTLYTEVLEIMFALRGRNYIVKLCQVTRVKTFYGNNSGGSPNHTGGNWPGSMTPTQPTCPKILNSIFFHKY